MGSWATFSTLCPFPVTQQTVRSISGHVQWSLKWFSVPPCPVYTHINSAYSWRRHHLLGEDASKPWIAAPAASCVALAIPGIMVPHACRASCPSPPLNFMQPGALPGLCSQGLIPSLARRGCSVVCWMNE